MHSSAGAVLSIDLAAIQTNFRTLQTRMKIGARCAGVVKADAYGLGARQVAPALVAAGCSALFVALLEEGLAVRAAVPDIPIYLLHGLPPQGIEDCLQAKLIPVLYSLAQIKRWQQAAYQQQCTLPAMLQVDTGMARLGLSATEMATLIAEPTRLNGLVVSHLISHFACADTPDHPHNATQLALFERYHAYFPNLSTSLANSAALFLPTAYHGDLARPGMALYGLNPTPKQENPMQPVVRLWGRVLQVREVPAHTSVGYGATFVTDKTSRLATISVGYADGYLRALSNRGHVVIGTQHVPVVGIVSMDMVIVDVSALAAEAVAVDDWVELIGSHLSIDTLAHQAGTIPYELLTSLSSRYDRIYSPATT